MCAVGGGLLGAQQKPPTRDVRVPGTAVVLKPGWKFVAYAGCGCAIPILWQPSFEEPLVFAPDGSSLSIRKQTIASWSEYVRQARRNYVAAVVHEESSHRLWFEISDEARIQHVIAVPSGATACVGILDVAARASADDAELIKQIAQSLGIVSESWAPETP
jgi:hypothetical protein